MANNLIIGLGGTGGKVLRELRKRIYEEFRSNDPDCGCHINYLYVDSSPADLNDRTGWKVLGKSVHLGDAQKVNINGISTASLQALGSYPGLQCFINDDDKQLIDQHMGPLISAGIGGQRRRLGRMLTANNICDRNQVSNNFLTKLHAAVSSLQKSSEDNDVTFTICAGLAGGTGSGSIVDVISQIRKAYPYQESTKAFKIRLVVYVPEINVVYPKHDNGFYQANGYAALTELNAISVGKYAPYDVSGEKDIFTQQVQRLMQNEESFEACYVYTNVNEKGKILDLSSKLPKSVADFIFQMVVVGSSKQGQMSRLVGCENDGAGPEHDLTGEPTRSRKFLSFGVVRVEYPESEIDEFVTYNYAIQATRQLAYNHWQDGLGYGECTLDEVGSGYLDEIKDPKNRGKLMLANADLALEKPIISNDSNKNWRPFNITWETRSQGDAGLVQQQYEKKQWLAQFTKLIDEYYNSGFRKHGVKKFFEIQTKEIKAYASVIRRHIEKKLFDEWASGGHEGKSILQIEKYTMILRQDCEDRIGAFKQQISKLELQRAEKEEEIKAANVKWNNIGWLKDAITNAASKTFAEFKTAKCEYYVLETKIESYAYAIQLLQQIGLELNSMLMGIQAMKQELGEILARVIDQASTKCQLNASQEDGRLKKYNPEIVHDLTKQYVADYDLQNANSTEIRQKMISMLGEDGVRSFAQLNTSIDINTASDIIVDICAKNARAAMEETAKKDPLFKMVGVNILEKLRMELNTEEKIEAFVDSVMNMASSYVQFNPTETAAVIGDNQGAMMPMVQVAMPQPSNDQEQQFVNALGEAFKNKQAGFVPQFHDGDFSVNSVNDKKNQIVVICANAGFPLRFLLNMQTLREKYNRLLAAPQGKLNKMVLHTESFATPLPDLFELNPTDLDKPAKKAMLIALALKLVQIQQDSLTGEKFLATKVPDEVFGDQWVKLGKDYLGCVNVLKQDYKKLKELEGQVEKELKAKARSNEQKAETRQLLGGVVQQIILPTVCEGNQFNPDYANYKNLALEIINEKLKDL